MKSDFVGIEEADLISSEAARRRFHPSRYLRSKSLGFHRGNVTISLNMRVAILSYEPKRKDHRLWRWSFRLVFFLWSKTPRKSLCDLHRLRQVNDFVFSNQNCSIAKSFLLKTSEIIMLFYNIPNRTLVFQNAKNRCPFSIYPSVTNRECPIGFFQNSVFQTDRVFGIYLLCMSLFFR